MARNAGVPGRVSANVARRAFNLRFVGETASELRRVTSFDRVRLRGLTADEVQRMMAGIAGRDVAWGISEAVHRQTEGNPLFVQEVLRDLMRKSFDATVHAKTPFAPRTMPF